MTNGKWSLRVVRQWKGNNIIGLGFLIINVSRLLFVRIHSNTEAHSNRGVKEWVEEKGFLESWSTAKIVNTILLTIWTLCDRNIVWLLILGNYFTTNWNEVGWLWVDTELTNECLIVD